MQGMQHMATGAAKAARWREHARGPQGNSGYYRGHTHRCHRAQRAPCAAGHRERGWLGAVADGGASARAALCFSLRNEEYPVKACSQTSLLPQRRPARCMTRIPWALSDRGEERGANPALQDGRGLEGLCSWIPWVLQCDG